MADYPAEIRDDGSEATGGPADPLASSYHTQVILAPGAMRYLMRGWRPGTSDFETWIATDFPNTNNPSGQPIINITIQSKWISAHLL